MRLCGWFSPGANLGLSLFIVDNPDQSSFKHNVTNSGNKCDCPCHESSSCATPITPHNTNTSVPPNATTVSSMPSTGVIPNATIVSSVTNASSIAPKVSSVPSTSVTPAATVVPGVLNTCTTPVPSVSSMYVYHCITKCHYSTNILPIVSPGGASMIPNATILPNQHGPVPVLNRVSMMPLVPSVLTPVGLQPLLPIV